MTRRIVNIVDLPMEKIGNGGRIEALMGRAGGFIGSCGLGCSSYVVPPGKSAALMHHHLIEHEVFFVLDGEGETRLDDLTLSNRSGDLIAAPAGAEAHQIINTETKALRYLAFSTESSADIIEHTDSAELMIEAGMGAGKPASIELLGIELLGRLTPADYHEGEN